MADAERTAAGIVLAEADVDINDKQNFKGLVFHP